ncbi:hypothetical protein EHP00_368 [Ecytonucleospora hepatopenaei]|uniref:Uncharacterized protein n=1 Tax=Ecytonucleospora hepatopenaei TaxID=646526 RepID=A0A1W0E9C6_9MICR|nr:hypothetical protein EHP00_368 [Ecytonucleospora hepatopenaei]
MTNRLSDKTNSKVDVNVDEKEMGMQNKQTIISFLVREQDKTEDLNLKYDISKCIEILEGKENQEVLDMKESLYDVLSEKERLFKENCELVCELEELKRKMYQ